VKDRISEDIKKALKAKDTLRLSTLRMILAELQNREKEKRIPVDSDTFNQILQSMTRKRKEAIDLFHKGKREDLAEKELKEIDIIAEYLPKQFSEQEIKEHVIEAISELGARGAKETGKVMGVLMKKLSGKADGGSISRIVKEELQKLDEPVKSP
jgi:hypothetical protein